MVLRPYGGLVWSRTLKTWKSIGFTVFSLKNVEKPLVLLCFRSKMLKNHWFYCVFAQKCWKTIGFTSKEALKPKKTLVLQCSLCKWILKLKKVKKPCVFPEKNVCPFHFSKRKSGFTIKRPRKRSGNGFGVWISNTRQEMLWGTLTDKLFREPLVLLCFRSQILKNHWFYCVFAQTCKKNNWFYCVFAQKC